jgi:uncharacterized membrane protein YdjX (TVP38/TMEM64 family)
MVYMTLFGAGKIIFGQWGVGFAYLAAAAAAGAFLFWHLSRRGWNVLAEGTAPSPAVEKAKGQGTGKS